MRERARASPGSERERIRLYRHVIDIISKRREQTRRVLWGGGQLCLSPFLRPSPTAAVQTLDNSLTRVVDILYERW